MKIRNKLKCEMYLSYAGPVRGMKIKAGGTSVELPPQRFYDTLLQRDWKRGRIDVLLSDIDKVVLGPAVADLASQTVELGEDGAEVAAQPVSPAPTPPEPATPESATPGPVTPATEVGADKLAAGAAKTAAEIAFGAGAGSPAVPPVEQPKPKRKRGRPSKKQKAAEAADTAAPVTSTPAPAAPAQPTPPPEGTVSLASLQQQNAKLTIGVPAGAKATIEEIGAFVKGPLG